jgi:hypothetical protein
MFTGFQERALNRNRQPEPQAPKHRSRMRVIIPIIAAIAVAAVVVVAIASNQPCKRSDNWQQDYYSSNAIIDFATYGIHLNAAGKIDKTYEYSAIQKMSKKARTADNVVLVMEDDSFGQADVGLNVPSTVSVDGVSYPFGTAFDVSIDSSDSAIRAYNALVATDPSISLRGKGQVMSLGQYVLGFITPKITAAIKSGALASPLVAYNGTGTQYNNDDIATAYKAGINANVFNQQCAQAPGQTEASAPTPDQSSAPTKTQNIDQSWCANETAVYDFSCRTVGVTFPNWATFVTQTHRLLKSQGLSISTPAQSQLSLNTAMPCRISQSSPSPVQTPPNQGGDNASGDVGGF